MAHRLSHMLAALLTACTALLSGCDDGAWRALYAG